MKKTIVYLFFLILTVAACATEKKENTFNNELVKVSTRVYLGKWNTKGIGEALPNGTLLLNPKDFKGDKVTIIRVLKSGNTKEVYYKDPQSETSWIYQGTHDQEKILNHQFKNTYMITQLVMGKDGGSLKERFEIPES
ncbi:hypothetical protein [Kangiella shandongensis]|uniref:hypothetical protein n=1 Tax=Kangiella shandongensis TaxID=2763258 RepID=UPI001CBF3ED2|nr:hypothetical protein [Kangiella shandongensis]